MPGLGKPCPGHSPCSGAGGRAPLSLTAGTGFPANKNWGSQSPSTRAGLKGSQAWWWPNGQPRSFLNVIYPIHPPTLSSAPPFLLLPPTPIPRKCLPFSLPTFEPPQSSKLCSWHLLQEALSDCCSRPQSPFPAGSSQNPKVEYHVILQISSGHNGRAPPVCQALSYALWGRGRENIIDTWSQPCGYSQARGEPNPVTLF